MDTAVELTGMEYGGITPIGLPADWPIYVDAAVASHAARGHRQRRTPVQADAARRRAGQPAGRGGAAGLGSTLPADRPA